MSKEWVSQTRPRFEIAPVVGLSPLTPLSAAGILTEPPVSVPSAAAHIPAATAAPDPPLEPPGIRSGSQGLRHGPKCGFCVVPP